MGNATASAPAIPASSLTFPSLQLVTHIESERLLDSEHFFDWIITSLAGSDEGILPIWLLVIEGHLEEIKRFRFRSRRLVEALLDQSQKVCADHTQTYRLGATLGTGADLYSQITSPDTKETSASLQSKLVAFIRALALTDPMCCILPHCWLKYESFLKLCFDEQDPRLNFCFRNLWERSLRLRRPPFADIVGSYQTPRQRLIALLDALGPDFDIGALSDSAKEIVDDHDVLISTLIEWATTLYRNGPSRIYLALRLFHQWSRAGLSLDQPVLRFIGHFSHTPGLHKPSMCKLFAELIRSKLLAVGKYLQWLIARGPQFHLQEAKTVSKMTPLLCVFADECRMRFSNYSCSITFPCMAYHTMCSIYGRYC